MFTQPWDANHWTELKTPLATLKPKFSDYVNFGQADISKWGGQLLATFHRKISASVAVIGFWRVYITYTKHTQCSTLSTISCIYYRSFITLFDVRSDMRNKTNPLLEFCAWIISDMNYYTIWRSFKSENLGASSSGQWNKRITLQVNTAADRRMMTSPSVGYRRMEWLIGYWLVPITYKSKQTKK